MSVNENFLDEFLRHQLLDIGDDDGRLANLQSAAQAVRDDLLQDLWKLSQFVRVGLNKDGDPDEPVFDEVEAKITEHWKLIRNKHTDRPISIIRAVLWEGIRSAVKSTESAAVAVLTANSESWGINLGPEGKACQEFLAEVAANVEQEAESAWTGLPEVTSGAANKKSTAFNSKLLAEKLLSASGPDGPDGAIKGANPHWPSANQPWSAEFSQRAAEGIADAVSRFFKAGQTTVDELATHVANELQNARLAVLRKTDLLWWSESKYCVTLAKGFEEVEPKSLPFFLANDVQRLALGLCPQSVDHFLGHVVNAQNPKLKKISIPDFLESLVAPENRAITSAIVDKFPADTGRCGLLSLVKQVLVDPEQIGQFDSRLNIEADTTFSPAELAKRVFWELKIASIVVSTLPEGSDE